MAGGGAAINSVTFNPLKTAFTVNPSAYENAGSIIINCSGTPDSGVYVDSISSSDDSIAEVMLDTSSRTVSGNNVVTGFRVRPSSAGTVTLTATAYDYINLRSVTGTLEITVTNPAPVEDDKFLNKRGLTHFWENIDDIKQDKLTAGTNITIAADNTISASQPTVNNATLTIQKNGTTVNTFTANASSNVTANISVPTKTSDLVNDGADNTAQYLETDETAYKTASIPYGECDSTSTATAYTATVPGITELRDGVCMLLKNGVVTSASGFTIDINGLGAKPAYSNMAAATRETTAFNINYTIMFVYDSDRVSGGCWVYYRGYYSDSNSLAYQIRTNSSTLPAKQTGYRYRLWLTSADGQNYVPINTSSSTSTTGTKALNTTTPIDPFGTIVYNSTNGTVNADASLPTGTQWTQYVLDMRYAKYPLTLTFPDPVYLQCTPQSTGGALINDIVQTLPTTEDGKIYIYLGNAYSAVSMELKQNHPVYYFKDGQIRLWTADISVRQPMSFTMQYEAGTHSEPLPGWRDDGLSELVVGPGVSPKIYKTSLVYEPGYSLASVSFINDKTGEQISSGDLYTILLGGADVVLNNVPLGSLWGDGWADASAHVDGLHLNRFSNIYKTNDTLTPIVGFGGSSAVFALFPGSGTPIQTELSFIITKLEDMTGFIRTQGISIGLL